MPLIEQSTNSHPVTLERQSTKTYDEVFEHPDADREAQLIIEWQKARRDSLESSKVSNGQSLIPTAIPSPTSVNAPVSLSK